MGLSFRRAKPEESGFTETFSPGSSPFGDAPSASLWMLRERDRICLSSRTTEGRRDLAFGSECRQTRDPSHSLGMTVVSVVLSNAKDLGFDSALSQGCCATAFVFHPERPKGGGISPLVLGVGFLWILRARSFAALRMTNRCAQDDFLFTSSFSSAGREEAGEALRPG